MKQRTFLIEDHNIVYTNTMNIFLLLLLINSAIGHYPNCTEFTGKPHTILYYRATDGALYFAEDSWIDTWYASLERVDYPIYHVSIYRRIFFGYYHAIDCLWEWTWIPEPYTKRCKIVTTTGDRLQLLFRTQVPDIK